MFNRNKYIPFFIKIKSEILNTYFKSKIPESHKSFLDPIERRVRFLRNELLNSTVVVAIIYETIYINRVAQIGRKGGVKCCRT